MYIYLDPRKSGEFKYEGYKFDYEPFYVGKGQNDQWIYHLAESNFNFNKYNQLKLNKIRKIKKETGEVPIIVKVKENLLESESFDLETELIKTIGRIDLGTGPLTNLTDGGEGTSGYIFTEEDRKKLREARKEIKQSEKTRKKRSEKLKLWWSNPENRDKVKGKKRSEEHKRKYSEANKGEKNPNWGKPRSEETKRKQREKMKLWWSIPENRNKRKKTYRKDKKEK